MASTDGSFQGVLYSMPVPGATKTTTTASLVSGNSATNPAFQMPALASIWPVSRMQGSVLQVIAGGTYDATAVGSTLVLANDTTQGTQATTIAGTGAVTVISTTTGTWNMELTLTCIGVSSNASSSGWHASGMIGYGTGNNAGTAGAAMAMVGGANALGVPSALALNNFTPAFWELWSTWGTAPTAFVCSQFVVMASN